MADIELVIRIPEEVYKRAQETPNTRWDAVWFGIKYGTPLPKGHGDLKDISKIDYKSGCFISSEGEPIPIIHKIATIEMIRDWLPTIIEADSEVEQHYPIMENDFGMVFNEGLHKELDREPTVQAIPIKQLEEMYEKFQKKLWSEHEYVRGDEMIEVGYAEQFLEDLLMDFGCWDSEVEQ